MTLFVVFTAGSQNLDNENLNVKFLRYPTDPLPEDIKTYTKDIQLSSLDADQDRASIESSMSSSLTLPGYELVDGDADLKLRLWVGSYYVTDINSHVEDKETKDKDGKVTRWKEYHYTFSYKYPVKLTITNTVTDEVLFDDYVNGSQDYTAGKSTASRDVEYARKSRDKAISESKSGILSNCFSSVDSYIKKKYGYTPTSDYVRIKRVKKYKKFSYDKIDQGVDILKAQLETLEPVEGYATEEFKAKVMEAVKLFDEELTEYDPYYKKARVNEKVASALYNNLALCFYWINDFDKALEAVTTADGLKGDGWTNTVLSEIQDKKQRYEANGLIN